MRGGSTRCVDLGPNHTGFNYPWIRNHPERFCGHGTLDDFRANPHASRYVEASHSARYVARGRDPHLAPWSDVAQLDFFNHETRAAMIVQLQALGEHCNSVRCDMAMLVLNDVFARTWGHLVRRSPPAVEFWSDGDRRAAGVFLFLAETYMGP